MKRFISLFLLLTPFFVISQKRLDLVHDNAFAFYDYREKIFCALDDSSFMWKYNVQKSIWVKSPIDLQIDMPFEKFLSDFIPMSDKDSPVYFISKGCGVVYMKNRNVIKRHDHSFYHMNQYSGAFFMDKGEPRIYGGYGLFTNKNIITRYDTTEREWFVISTGTRQPLDGIKSIVQKRNKSYYVFDGFTGVGRQYVKNKDIWRLDLKTLKWRIIGKLNPNIQCRRMEYPFEEYQNPQYGPSCFENAIVSYDFNKMKYKKYRFHATGIYKNIIQVDSLFLILKTTSLPSRFLVISDSSFLKQFDYEEGEIIMAMPNPSNDKMGFIFIFLAIIVLFIFWKGRKESKFILNRKAKIKDSEWTESDQFNQTEMELLQLLLLHQKNGLEISFINDLVNHDQPSIDTLKKRREILFKELRFKLASKFKIPQDEVFIERRMESDKRMKLLFLNDKVKIKF